MMKTTSLMIAGAATIVALGSASVAFAQAKPPAKPAAAPASSAAAPPAAAPQVITASVPGFCMFSRDAVVGASTVGKYVQTRLGQLESQVNAELAGEQTAIQNDAKAIDAKKATLGDAGYQQQMGAVQQRAEAWQQKRELRGRELQATQEKAFSRILQEASPLLGEQLKAKGCAVVVEAGTILAINPSMDLTGAVVTELNGKLTQFAFEREHLDAQPGGPQR